MRAAVIYYSLEGNTEFIARMIAEEAKAKMFKLETRKEFPTKGFKKFFVSGGSVLFHRKPELKEESFNLEAYDTLIIGSPIWAGTYASPLNTFLSLNEIKNKTIYLFACHGSGDADKYYSKMKERLHGNIIADTIDFLEPIKKDKCEIAKKVSQFCKANF